MIKTVICSFVVVVVVAFCSSTDFEESGLLETDEVHVYVPTLSQFWGCSIVCQLSCKQRKQFMSEMKLTVP